MVGTGSRYNTRLLRAILVILSVNFVLSFAILLGLRALQPLEYDSVAAAIAQKVQARLSASQGQNEHYQNIPRLLAQPPSEHAAALTTTGTVVGSFVVSAAFAAFYGCLVFICARFFSKRLLDGKAMLPRVASVSLAGIAMIPFSLTLFSEPKLFGNLFDKLVDIEIGPEQQHPNATQTLEINLDLTPGTVAAHGMGGTIGSVAGPGHPAGGTSSSGNGTVPQGSVPASALETDCGDNSDKGHLRLNYDENQITPNNMGPSLSDIQNALLKGHKGRKVRAILIVGSASAEPIRGKEHEPDSGNDQLAKKRSDVAEESVIKNFQTWGFDSKSAAANRIIVLNSEASDLRLILNGKPYDSGRSVMVCAVWDADIGGN